MYIAGCIWVFFCLFAHYVGGWIRRDNGRSKHRSPVSPARTSEAITSSNVSELRAAAAAAADGGNQPYVVRCIGFALPLSSPEAGWETSAYGINNPSSYIYT